MHVNKYSPLLVLRPGLKPGEDEHQQSAMRTGEGMGGVEPRRFVWALLCRAGSRSIHLPLPLIQSLNCKEPSDVNLKPPEVDEPAAA